MNFPTADELFQHVWYIGLSRDGAALPGTAAWAPEVEEYYFRAWLACMHFAQRVETACEIAGESKTPDA